jgi:hypothetical protein
MDINCSKKYLDGTYRVVTIKQDIRGFFLYKYIKRQE